jgi:hypothetical protein
MYVLPNNSEFLFLAMLKFELITYKVLIKRNFKSTTWLKYRDFKSQMTFEKKVTRNFVWILNQNVYHSKSPMMLHDSIQLTLQSILSRHHNCKKKNQNKKRSTLDEIEGIKSARKHTHTAKLLMCAALPAV